MNTLKTKLPNIIFVLSRPIPLLKFESDQNHMVLCKRTLTRIFIFNTSYKPLVDEALKLASAPPDLPVVVYQRPGMPRANLDASKGDLDWAEVVGKVGKGHDCVDVDSDGTLYMLYTSGTTGGLGAGPL